jgi:hypothetical protein
MRSQEDIQLIKALQFSIERLQVDFDAVVEGRDIARADLEKVVGYNTKLQKEADYWKAETHRVAKKRDEALDEVEQLKQALHDARMENSGQAAQLERKRPEPSRLEIAAMIYAGSGDHGVASAFVAADKLIAVTKEAK